jgi:hypothetical protein
LRTMGHETLVNSHIVSGLENFVLESDDWIKLPPVLTQHDMPVSENDIVSPDDLQKWPYLASVPLDRKIVTSAY